MPKILLCDDEPDILRSLKFMFESEGYDVVTTLSGGECIETARSEKPDFIFLDIMMPEMDGWETLKNLKENKDLKHIPVSMLTVTPLTIESYKQGYGEGLMDYVVKPLNREDLIDIVNHAIKS